MQYLFIVSIIWAFSFGLIKDQLTGLDAVYVAWLRLSIAFIIFIPFLNTRELSRRKVLQLLVNGAVQYGLMYVAYLYAYQYLQAYEVALFTILTPLYISVMNDIGQRKFAPFNLFIAFLAIVGALIIEYRAPGRTQVLTGFLLVQVSNACFAFGQIYYKKLMHSLPGKSDRSVFGLLYLGAVLISGLFLVVRPDTHLRMPGTSEMISLLYLGVVASGLGFFLWNFGARRVSTGSLAVFNNLKIPLAVIVALLFFGEQAEPGRLITGGSFMLAALAFSEYRRVRATGQSAV